MPLKDISMTSFQANGTKGRLVERNRNAPASCIFEVHGERRVLVRVLGKCVGLGDSIVKGLLGQVAGTVGRVEDLAVEHGKFKHKTKIDRVGWRELSDGNVGGGLVSLEGLVSRAFPFVASGELGEVTVLVTHPVRTSEHAGQHHTTKKCKIRDKGRGNVHLVVEDLGLARPVLVENVKNVPADLSQL